MKLPPSILAACVTLLGVASSSTAAPAKPSVPDNVVRGPVFSGTIKARFPEDKNTAMKGIVVTLNDTKDAFMCYDTDLMRVSVGWRGDFLEFGNGQREIIHPPPPSVKGRPVFGTKVGPGWAKDGSFTDPRERHQGPLPREWAKYRGLYQYKESAVLSYTVGDCEVLETPGMVKQGDLFIFTRTFTVGPSKVPQSMALVSLTGGDITDQFSPMNDERGAWFVIGSSNRLGVAFLGGPDGSGFELGTDTVNVKLPASKKGCSFTLAIAAVPGDDTAEAVKRFGAALKSIGPSADLKQWTKGGPARWNTPVITAGALATSGGDGAYAVDTISEVLTNPWNARTFFSGFDFFPDGRAAICTFHGDVWTVSGIDAKLDKLTWRRYATGLFQPLGLKIVKGETYVIGRDQLTRLHDLNKDGEADFYECFNNDTVVTENYHEFCLDLHTDSKGNFYYAKGSPWDPSVTTPHQGTMLKVSPDGSKLEVFASGLRAPNGSAIGPRDEITVSDNQGHWMPASKLSLLRQGGFYGMMPAAQREITLLRGEEKLTLNPSDPQIRASQKVKPFNGDAPIPASYDQPISWLPMNMDNSSGGQVWATGNKCGPLKNHLLFMSYGRGTLFEVMLDEVDGVTQASMVRLPLKFQTGLSRGRMNPKDGQIYVCGLRGWQTDGTRDGGLYRVRYTGKPAHLPVALHARKNGLEIKFTDPLDPASATDLANYSIDQWNYLYSGGYGSADYSVKNPKAKGRDKVEIKSARLAADKRTVLLEIPDLLPAMQTRVKLSLKGADGAAIAHEIYSTIHKTGSASLTAAR